MKKSFKAIVAIMLVALFAIAMIPAVSAANQLVVKNESKEFSFDLYKVASLDKTTGKYTVSAGVDASIVNAINTKDQSGADFLNVLDAVTDTSKLGEFLVNLSGKDGGTSSYTITADGIYYAVVKDKPSGDIAKVKNSVIVWPEYKGGWNYDFTSLDLGSKVGTDKITKAFADTEADSKSAKQGQVIEFVLTADRVGSSSDLATSYVIWDDMCPGLEYVKDSANITYDGETDANADFTVATSKITENIVKYSNGTHFTFTANTDVLNNKDSNYYKADEVIITYKATVLNSAGIGKDYNPNKDGLKYELTSGKKADKAGREIKVYTYAAKANKIDATATAKAKAENASAANVALKGAVIGLYTKGDDNKLTEIARGTSDENGNVSFKNGNDEKELRLAPGKYIVKEISAPAGYALSTVEYDLEVKDDNDARNGDGFFSLDGNKVIENFATKMPETGGQGTWMFTLIGAGLILCAGVLFVIIMKKKAAK